MSYAITDRSPGNRPDGMGWPNSLFQVGGTSVPRRARPPAAMRATREASGWKIAELIPR
jgi:hypothetical protein